MNSGFCTDVRKDCAVYPVGLMPANASVHVYFFGFSVFEGWER